MLWAQPSDYTVKAKAPRSPEINRVLARTDASLDQWLGERDYESINALLQRDKQKLPWPSPILNRFARVTLMELKIVSSSRASEAQSTTRLRLPLELGGETIAGERLSLLGPGEAEFQRTGSEWKLTSFQPGALRELRAAGPAFRDVTDRALGHNSSYREQLAKSLDHWRTVLDEATGIDVYGHNGLAAGDYNGDGLEDIYACQPSGLPSRLYRNNGDGTFDDVSRAAGVDIMDASSMALFADLDNDGDQDLLLRNDGTGRFQNDPASGLRTSPATLTSAALADYDRDGDLDLYVCAYDFWTAIAETEHSRM